MFAVRRSLSQGVCTSGTVALGNAIPSQFFQDLSIVFLVLLALLYIGVLLGTVHGVLTGTVFVAPCLHPMVMHAPLEGFPLHKPQQQQFVDDCRGDGRAAR